MRGINVAGHLNSTGSLGIACREYLSLFRELGYNIALNNLPLRTDKEGGFFPKGSLTLRNPHEVNYLHFNPDQFLKFWDTVGGAKYFHNKHTIGFWVWECSRVLPRWKSYAHNFQEIWTASEYCKNIFEREFPDIPCRVVNHVVEKPKKEVRLSRIDLGLPLDKFIYMYSFDAWSRVDRKNPIALVRAFDLVREKYPDSYLLLKSRNLTGAQTIQILGSHNQDSVMILDHYLTTEKLWALYGLADCFVSPHKSEGFGLHVAEAMLSGTPVVATGFSGVTQVCRDDTCWMVDFEIEPARDPYYKPSDGVWALPNIEHMASQMIKVRENEQEAIRRAQNAKNLVLEQCSRAAVKKRMEKLYENAIRATNRKK